MKTYLHKLNIMKNELFVMNEVIDHNYIDNFIIHEYLKDIYNIQEFIKSIRISTINNFRNIEAELSITYEEYDKIMKNIKEVEDICKKTKEKLKKS